MKISNVLNQMSKFYFVSFVFIVVSQPLSAQDSLNSKRSSTISITGEIGAYGELYNISNLPERRPNSTGRLFFRPTLNVLDLFQIPFEILVSTERSSARQNMNQFGLNPKWSWGSANLGDFNEDYSKFTLSGIKIRGGGITINPGIFKFSTSIGFTNRGVYGGAQNGAYDRFLFATKIGLGKEEETNFNLIFLRAKDEISSLDQNNKSITVLEPNGDDSWPIGSLQTIRWNSINIGGAVAIEISRDGGNSFELIQNNVPNTGFFDWTVSGPVTLQALIRVKSFEDADVSDVSDFLFSIGTGSEFPFKKGNRLTEINNPNSVTPQENLVVGLSGKVIFLGNMLVLDYEAGGSLYSRDIRASQLDLDSSDYPNLFSKIFTPRVGSNYDYALNTQLHLNLKSYNGKLGYKRIGPGYNSLGLAYLLNDQQEISFMNAFRISKFAITLGFINLADNLNDQKFFTTSRNTYIAGISGSITEEWNTSLIVNALDMGNNADTDSTKTNFQNLVISSTQSFLLGQKTLLRSVSLTYVFQSSNNKSYSLSDNTTKTHTLNTGLNFYISDDLNSTFSAGLTNSTIFDTLKNTTTNISLVTQGSLLERNLNLALNLGTAFNNDSNSYRSGLTAGYNLSNDDIITVALWFTRFNGTSDTRSSFSEILSSLNYSHRF